MNFILIYVVFLSIDSRIISSDEIHFQLHILLKVQINTNFVIQLSIEKLKFKVH